MFFSEFLIFLIEIFIIFYYFDIFPWFILFGRCPFCFDKYEKNHFKLVLIEDFDNNNYNFKRNKINKIEGTLLIFSVFFLYWFIFERFIIYQFPIIVFKDFGCFSL